VSRDDDLQRIAEALEAAKATLSSFAADPKTVETKAQGDPVTAADRAVNQLLLDRLPLKGEGWLSEETTDDPSRLRAHRVWIVDPIDGTKEYIEGIPEWSVSIGLVEGGLAVAGGICNPVTGETVLGSRETGVFLNGQPVQPRSCARVTDALVLASRTEVSRGQWDQFQKMPFTIRPVGSVAYKLACVAAGLADATWTLMPKHEWDVAAGVALVSAAGGVVKTLEGRVPQFNRPKPLLDGLLAFSSASYDLLADYARVRVPNRQES